MLSSAQVIEILKLHPLPIEGGYFGVTYTSDERLPASVLPPRYKADRDLGGAIYYLETSEQFSSMHRLPTDEIYYYHFGDPVEMLLLSPQGDTQRLLLGMDLLNDQRPQILVPRFWWQGSRPLPDGDYGYSLLSTSMAPGYHPNDPEFASREELIMKYPDEEKMIKNLTRV